MRTKQPADPNWCQQCGDLIHRGELSAKRYKKRKFCGRKCQSKAQEGVPRKLRTASGNEYYKRKNEPVNTVLNTWLSMGWGSKQPLDQTG
jgi:hypothetical protein